ncbi:oligosaccharide flippase family protein [Pseudocolwellia sp. AS88]|uniref:lipopolysaccharide biosynthesis protein n=1 Tax=Pseudocolwellia sp. AS88 TaxID=3063958 RepID=UPI0026EA2F73|nr:oligosaccharide flippase family protein [Pseudocolwellia sp. AS88]MDO7085024.1 oligosaccharide flippase family protein [Pseudocolwellia sp. AS88]
MKVINGNTINLAFVQLSNYIFPIVSIPLMISNVGIKQYGVFISSYSLALLVSVLVEFGCNYHGVRSIANEGISSYLGTFYTKILISLALISTYPILTHYLHLNLIDILLAICIGMSPSWIYQGIKHLTVYSFMVTLQKIVLLILIYFCADSSEDLLIIYTLSFFILNVAGHLYLYLYKKLELSSFKLDDVFDVFKQSWSISLSRVLNSITTVGVPFILSKIFLPEFVAVYSICEKIFRTVCSLNNPLVQGLLPYFEKGLEHKRIISKVLIILFLFNSISIVIIYNFSALLVNWFSISEPKIFIDLLLILLWGTFFVSVSNVLGILGCVHRGDYHILLRASLLSALTLTIIVFAFKSIIGIYSAAYAVITAELLVACYLTYENRKLFFIR